MRSLRVVRITPKDLVDFSILNNTKPPIKVQTVNNISRVTSSVHSVSSIQINPEHPNLVPVKTENGKPPTLPNGPTPPPRTTTPRPKPKVNNKPQPKPVRNFLQ